MRIEIPPVIASALLFLGAVPLLGCPQLIFGLPAAMRSAPRFQGPELAEARSRFVPIEVDFETGGHALAFHLRVDEKNLEPTAGACRRWFLARVAREAETAQESFCRHDTVRFYLEAAVEHRLEFLVGSQHTVATRVLLSPGENIRWRLPITTRRVDLSIALEPGYRYTVQGREELSDLGKALAEDAPTGTRWKLDEHDPIFYTDVEVGTMRIRVLRNVDRLVVSEVSAPLYSGRTKCGPPFCTDE